MYREIAFLIVSNLLGIIDRLGLGRENLERLFRKRAFHLPSSVRALRNMIILHARFFFSPSGSSSLFSDGVFSVFLSATGFFSSAFSGSFFGAVFGFGSVFQARKPLSLRPRERSPFPLRQARPLRVRLSFQPPLPFSPRSARAYFPRAKRLSWPPCVLL